ncbi:MAG TPA: TetR/AcrR family transcriptional regulator [Candidatus Corynebacterium avicola]|uniref:TetR/AcrR family transcriptional regulator n=1 Tax=Candidatus Corynebacterium avicola TaxID=2838527 RepID=A0A9D1RMI8_9CORY|nr:TetR/AcrR family transcriptional regulator [Candidatus Corynebacterium avicola]
MKADECGLRERKLRETRLRIEDCGTKLILERGFDQVTIDEICEEAGISRRSFFNYFDSKDQVAAGRGIPPIPEEVLEKYVTRDSDNIVRDILHLVAVTLDNDPTSSLDLSPDRELSLVVRARRREIVSQTPLLSAGNMRRFDAFAGVILDCLTGHLTNFPDRRHLPDIPLEHEAALLTALIRESIAVSSLLHRQDPELSKQEIVSRTGRRLTALAGAYASDWD